MNTPASANPQARHRRFALRSGAYLPAVLGLMVAAVGVGVTAWTYSQQNPAEIDVGVTFSPVFRGLYEHIILEQGQVESEINVELRCEVKSRSPGGTKILWLVEEGAFAKQGETVVLLDKTVLEQELVQQRIACNTCRASMIEAENTLRAAEISRTEYLEGTFRKEEQIILGEIFVAEESLRRAQLAFQSSERLASRGSVTSLQAEGDRFAVQKAKNELEAAQAKLEILRKYTKAKTVKQFDSDIAIAAAKWDADKKSYELEQEKLREIEEQIEKCTIVAPEDGQVVYANVFDHHGSVEFVIEAGASVRERQVIVRLPDREKMQIKAAINEPRIPLIKPGLPVSIQLDAIPGRTFRGEVTKVNQYAEPMNFHSGSIRQYATWISMQDPPPEVRSGMNAELKIYAEQTEDALQIPIQAIYETKGRFFCLLKDAKGWETREVQVGSSNDNTIIIEANLEEGERIVMHPRSYRDKLQIPAPIEAAVVMESRHSINGNRADAAQ